jgi:DNA-binding response OmpR family regulator
MEEKLKIFFCEDDENLGMLLREYLQAKGYVTDLFSDGEAGYKGFTKGKYDLCVLDVMMPKKDGFTLAQEIRALNPDIPVIFLTAKTMKEDILEGFKIGADDYLTKPFSLKELLARLRSLERRSEDYQEDVLNFADITLDNDEQRLESHNSISLSGKETKLLAYLMKNPGKAIESSILLDQGWDKDDEADETDLWIYISYLRQKLQAVNAHVTIVGEKGGPFTLSQLA